MKTNKFVTLNSISFLLKQTKTQIENHKQIIKIRGEKFNIFSILNMERAENNTHSNFIAELLNPDGSHLMGDIFLKLFLTLINKELNQSIKGESIIYLDIESTKVKVEKDIGRIKNGIEAEGGRIDIFLWDDKNNIISIENKIDAGDQFRQIERYCNYKRNNENVKHTVLYLTKDGLDPSGESRGELIEFKKEIEEGKKKVMKSGIDFWNISYKIFILKWLEQCLKETSDKPILRESIKQYNILIKKITNTMDEKESEEVKKLIIGNLEAARYIRDNTNSVLEEIRTDFRESVKKLLESELKPEKTQRLYKVHNGNDVNSKFSQLWISFDSVEELDLNFGIETFSGTTNGHEENSLFIGITNRTSKTSISDSFVTDKLSNYWVKIKRLEFKLNPKEEGNSKVIKMRDPEFIRAISEKDKDPYTSIMESLVEQIIAFIKDNEEEMMQINNEKR